MAIKLSLVIFICIYEVKPYVHQYAVNPYYAREPRPPVEVLVIDPKTFQNYGSPRYAHPKLESAPNYAVYQKPIEPIPEVKPRMTPVEVPIPPLIKEKPCAGYDSNVLNNLAIALQLLIINNLMNNPMPQTSGIDVLKNCIEQTKSAISPLEMEFDYVAPMPNAKFLGSSSFYDGGSVVGLGNYGSPPPSSRAGFMLKSPYEALSSSSLDSASKRNVQSPYSSIFAADNMKDLFSMSDYYELFN